MKVKNVEFFPKESEAEEGVFYFNIHKKVGILYRGSQLETYEATLPNLGEPGSRFQDSDGDGIPDIREASYFDMQDIGWTTSDGNTFTKATYTANGVTVNSTQVSIASLDNPQKVLFNGGDDDVHFHAIHDGAIQRHNNNWYTFSKGDPLNLNPGDYLIYDVFLDDDGDGVSNNDDAFPNNPNEHTDADGDGVGSNSDVDDNDPNRSSGIDSDGDGTDNEFDLNDNDGPLGDLDSDGIPNQTDVFPQDATNTKFDQILSWNEYSGPIYLSSGTHTLSASLDTGLLINYSVISGPATVSGNTLTLNGGGTVKVQAFNSGSATHNSITETRDFNIADDMADDDNDGVVNSNDNFPSDPNRASGNDIDGDGIDDEFDNDNTDGPLGDSDNDGVNNSNDNYPGDPNRASGTDSDGDGTDDEFDSDNTDGPLGDSDNDGVNNSNDNFPNDPNRASGNDIDNDGIDDEFDNDDDNDGVINSNDNFPNDPNRASGNDIDGDSIDDEFDSDNTDGPLGDSDGDGVINQNDGFPDDPNRASGTDSDGDGTDDELDNDNTDGPLGDSDGDGVINQNDGFPDDPTRSEPDSDNDGISDAQDPDPFTPNPQVLLKGTYTENGQPVQVRYARTYYHPVDGWFSPRVNNGGYQKYEWIWHFDAASITNDPDNRVSYWKYFICDASGQILPGEDVLTMTGNHTITLSRTYDGSPGDFAGVTKYMRARPILQSGTAQWSTPSGPLTATGLIDDPHDYRNHSSDKYTYKFEAEYGGSDLNGHYETVKGPNSTSMLFNGAPVWRRTNLTTSSGIPLGNSAIDPCVVLHLEQRPSLNPNRYGTNWWHHWVFCEWSDIVNISGYPDNYPDPLAEGNNDGYDYWPSSTDDQGYAHIPGNAPYINPVYLPPQSEGILSTGSSDLALNGVFDTWTRKHPGLFALPNQQVKTFNIRGDHIFTTLANSNGELTHVSVL